MDIREYFAQKDKIKNEQLELERKVQALTSSFSDKYYFTIAKNTRLISSKVECDFNIGVYFPCIDDRVFSFNFPVKLNFGNYLHLSLQDFNGFSCNISHRPLVNQRKLFLMYPEVSCDEIFDEESTMKTINKNVVYRESQSIYDIKFEDFLAIIPDKILNYIRDIHFKDQKQQYHHILSDKQRYVIYYKFKNLISRLSHDMVNHKPDGFAINDFLAEKSLLDKKIFHHQMDKSLPQSHLKKQHKL